LRTCAEEIGVFVLLISNLGSHHSTIPVEAFRGFVIADPIAPFVVINDQDAKTAWSFTLVHEIVHLWLGATGVSGADAENAIEQFCNDIAGEFLLPKAELRSLNIGKTHDLDATIAALSAFAEERNLSRVMVAYKLYRTGAITWDAWHALNKKLRAIWLEEKAHQKARDRKSDSGPSYYVVRRHRLGRALLEFASRNVLSGTLSPVKAGRILGVKPRSVHPLLLDVPQRSTTNKKADG
jgi:Zn-dependent peptidase ImmA (M78 family)